MSLPHLIPSLLATAVALVSIGCGPATEYYAPAPDPYYERVLSAGRAEPSTDAERELLVTLADHPVDQPVQAGDGGPVAGPAYAAGSGYICRQVSGTSDPSIRLVCGDGQQWFFVPDVFGAPSTASSAE